MDWKLTRRDLLKGIIAAFGAFLASCVDRGQRTTKTDPTSISIASPSLAPTATHKPTSIAETLPTPMAKTPALEELHEAMFYQQLDDERVQCHVCFRSCIVPNGGRGFCRNKTNIDGRYYTLVYGRPSALQIDPIEKEPHFHMLPGALIFCTGTSSCNNRCKFCHNWHLSQRSFEETTHVLLSPEETVELADHQGCEAVSFTYNEPTVFYEHMLDVVIAAKQLGLRTLVHTNGGIQEKPLAELLTYIDAVTVDLKAFTQKFYRDMSSSELQPVLRTLQQVHESDAHLEIVNLMIPTHNDSPEEINAMCQWICDTLSDEVPIHFNRFFPAYKLTSLPPTPIETLERAAEIADEAGLKFVYIGNTPGHKRNSTFCPNCGKKIIERIHFTVLSYEIEDGKCSACGCAIPGIWWKT